MIRLDVFLKHVGRHINYVLIGWESERFQAVFMY
jgi:hypothetical protein